jgi:hypothetical protein
MIRKNGKLIEMCIKCIDELMPVEGECEWCEHDLRQEYADNETH